MGTYLPSLHTALDGPSWPQRQLAQEENQNVSFFWVLSENSEQWGWCIPTHSEERGTSMQDLLRDGQSSLSHFPPPVGWRMQNRVRERSGTDTELQGVCRGFLLSLQLTTDPVYLWGNYWKPWKESLEKIKENNPQCSHGDRNSYYSHHLEWKTS